MVGNVEEHYKKEKYNNMYMNIASTVAEMSYCKRKQVGAVLIRDGRILSMGWNGTRAGESNNCEDEHNTTLPGVAHAEENCLKKLITSNDNSIDTTMYITAPPCLRCAEKIVDAKISSVYYAEKYGNDDGIDYLNKHNISIQML